MIAALDSSLNRLNDMGKLVNSTALLQPFIGFTDAAEMIQWLAHKPATLELISLCYDCDRGSGALGSAGNMGDGMAVIDYLVSMEPCYHVILHTWSQTGIAEMALKLTNAGWCNSAVSPTGDNWLDDVWLSEVCKRVNQASAVF